ncbi:MAG: D-tyrosyl-tRNA(Tyr) deacylase [Phycisphaerales bacterium]|nr:D-tyrosyl-tRNA(Tyr) deacylase [Phycisphaerales bacterium]
MRAGVQRVRGAVVEVEGACVGRIGGGLLVYLGIQPDDGGEDVAYIAEKVRHLRVFSDAEGMMNEDVVQAGGSVLVVSAFTTMADARHGRRPSFAAAARGATAEPMYERVCAVLLESGVTVEKGRFGAMMKVTSDNDGPVCVLLDSRRGF